MNKQKTIGEVLVAKGLITEDGLKDATDYARREGVRLVKASLALGLIPDEELLAKVLAEQYGLKVTSLETATIDDRALELIPSEVLHSAGVIPIKDGDNTILAVTDPGDIVVIDDIERLITSKGGSSIKEVSAMTVSVASEVDSILTRGHGSERILKDAADEFHVEDLKVSEFDDEGVLTIDKITKDSSPVVKLVDTAIYDALTKQASDIHLESTAEGLVVKYRLDGVLHKIMGPVEKNFQASIISRIKVMSELDISERRIPQDGRFKIRFKGKTIDFRVSIMPSIHGEDAVIRILDKEHITKEFKELRLDSLGFGERERKILRKMISEPYGMFLVTGPTGSGKTTTLYAAISEINTGKDKIITIEDPVEYELQGITQIPVNEKKGLTFAKGLRSILRHDPDKIMVGEIRDSETAEIAIQAALTGHLVFTTVHANNVFDVIGRFIHMGIEPYNFVSSLNCVIAQRLLRMICTNCKRPLDELAAKALKEELISYGVDKARFDKGVELFNAKGCEVCYDTGYSGRKAIVEILELSDELKDLIASKEPPSVIKNKAFDEGMVTLRTVALECVLRGETTLEEVDRITFAE